MGRTKSTDATRELDSAARAAAAARRGLERRDDAIRAAAKAGATRRAIADRVGLSHQRVQQIIRSS